MKSYYGRQIVKTPVWRPDIPAYLFCGGLAAGSALLAAGADLTRRPALRRSGRLTALGAVAAGAAFLIHDLGRPARFHHMLRVVKPTSPMSIGTWTLTAFGPAAGLAAAAELTGVAPAAGRAAGLAAAGLAPALATYTAVLLADTAVPSWHEAYPQLPFAFAGSALASAAGAGLLAAPTAEAGPARRLAVAGAAMELAASHRLASTLGLTGEPYRSGRAGALLRASQALTAAGIAGAVLGGARRDSRRRRARLVSALSGAALLAAGALTRFGIFAAGVASTKDPRYTVVPQRARLEQSAADAAGAAGGRPPAGSADDERGAVGPGRDQLADDRVARDLPGDEEPA
jgi:formate-dependent nitrite reductase membrane component NrfD